MFTNKLTGLIVVLLILGSTIGRPAQAEPVKEKTAGKGRVVWQKEKTETPVPEICETTDPECDETADTACCDETPKGYQQRMEKGLNEGLANLVWGPLEIIGQPLAYAVEGRGDDVKLTNIFLAPGEILSAPFTNPDGEEPEGLGIVGFIGGVPVGIYKGGMRMLYGAGTLPSAPFGVYTPWQSYWEHKRHANFIGIGNILYGPVEVLAQPFAYAVQDGNEFQQFVWLLEGIPVGIVVGSTRVLYGITSLIMSPFDSSVIPPLDKTLKMAGRKGPDFLIPKCTDVCK